MGTVNTVSRCSKFWILATITSLALYDLYWLRNTYNWLYVRLQENQPDLLAVYPNFYIDHVAGAVANTLRLVGVILLFVAAYFAWGRKKQSFIGVKKYVGTALLLEAIYWLAILPYNIQSVFRSRIPLLLYVGYIIEILTIATLLIALSIKAWEYKANARNNLIKWGCIAGTSYIFGLWINNLFRWLSMSGLFGATDPRITVNILSGISSLGFLNTAITLSLSLALSIAGSYILIIHKNRKLGIRLLGLAVLLFGLHFALYVLYSWFAPNAWLFLLLTEIWPIPLIGLGIGLLRGKS